MLHKQQMKCSPCAEELWSSGFWEMELLACPSGCSPPGPDSHTPGDRCSYSLTKTKTHQSEKRVVNKTLSHTDPAVCVFVRKFNII